MDLVKVGEKDDRMILQDEQGRRGVFTFEELCVADGREYAAISDEADEVYFMRFTERGEDGREHYTEIESDAVFEAVAAAFAALEED